MIKKRSKNGIEMGFCKWIGRLVSRIDYWHLVILFLNLLIYSLVVLMSNIANQKLKKQYIYQN